MREKIKIMSVLAGAVFFVSLLYLIMYGGVVHAEETMNEDEMEDQLKQEETEQKREAIKAAYFQTKRGRSGESGEKKQMQVETGRVIKYNGYSTNYFEADGKIAWCLEPARGTPASGSYSVAELKSTSDLAKAMYYSTDAPGEKILERWFGSEGYWQIQDVRSGAPVASWDERYSYSHMFLSWIYNDFDYDVAFYGTNLPEMDWYPKLKKDFTNKLTEIRGLPQPTSGFRAYVIDTGNKKQVMGGFTYTEEGRVKLKKNSSDTKITSGNNCYHLEGAEYGVYKDSACTEKAGSLKTEKDGNSNLLTVAPGKYYVKETKASEGYALDLKIYKITVSDGQETQLDVKEIPQSNPVDLLMVKTDEECEKSQDLSKKTQGCASLEGAEFEVRYYAGYYESDPEKTAEKAEKCWIMKTDEEGKIQLSDSYKLSGDEFYYNASGETVFPLGTVTIQEKKAPEGYLKNDQVYICKITSEGMAETVKTYYSPCVSEKVIRGDIQLVKFAEDRNLEQDQKTPLKGIIFTLTSKTTGEVYRITTDENGYATTKQLEISERGNLVYDTYIVHETNTPEGMKPVKDFEVQIDQEGQTKYYILENKQVICEEFPEKEESVKQKIPEKVKTEVEKKEKKEVKKEKKIQTVKTGDDQDGIILKLVLLMVSATVLAGGILCRKQKNNTKM